MHYVKLDITTFDCRDIVIAGSSMKFKEEPLRRTIDDRSHILVIKHFLNKRVSI